MSNEIEIEVKVDGKEAEVGLDEIGQKAKESGEKVTEAFVRARDELGRFTKAGTDAKVPIDGITNSTEKAIPRLNALGRLLSSFKLEPIDLKVNPNAALKQIELTRLKLREIGKAAGTTAEMKIDAEKALAGLGKLERGIGDVAKWGEQAGSFLENVFSNFADTLNQGVSAAVDGLKAGLSNLASGGLNALASAFMAILGMIPIALAGFAALAPAILAVGGAAGAATTLLASMGIGLATLAIGFGGIGAALTAHTKAAAGAGKAASNTAEQQYQAAKRIHDAERSLADAKMNEVDAAKAVNQARQDEITRLRQLNIELEGQKASQADAAQALVEAKEKARRANIAGSAWEKTNANNAVADAQANYDAITEKLSETTAAKKKSVQVGVEGSDQVQAALKREASAHEQVIKAQEALADAHHKTAVAAASAAGGVNTFAQAMQKLSPNAQKLVYALISIEQRFDAIKKRVQDRLLAGFDTSVKDLADKWLPHLDSILGGTADHLNKFGKGLMGALGDSTFIKNMEKAGKSGETFIDQMSVGVDALVDAFGRLAGHSGPVLKVIGKAIQGIFVWFDKWIKGADKSGALDSFMKQAADTLQKIFDIGGKVVKVVGKFIEIIFPSSKTAGDSVLDGLNHALDQAGKWLNDPKNQKAIKQIADDIAAFIKMFVKYAIPAIGVAIKLIGDMITTTVLAVKWFWNLGTNIKNAFADAWNWVSNKTASVLNWINSAAHRVGNDLYGMWQGLKNGFKDALNWVISKWNNLSFPLPGFLGGPIDTPNIPYLASGGIRGGLAMVGERGRELVKLPHGSTVIPHGTTEGMMAAAGGAAAHVMLGFDRNTGNKLMNAIIEGLQGYVKARGGNVQVALGRHGS